MIKSDIKYLLKETKFFGMEKEELIEIIDETYKTIEDEVNKYDNTIKKSEVKL